MKFIFDKEKTIARMRALVGRRERLKRMTRFCTVLNVAALIFVAIGPVSALLFDQPYVLSDFLVDVCVMGMVLCSVWFSRHSENINWDAMITLDVWYDLATGAITNTSGDASIEVKIDETANGRTISFIGGKEPGVPGGERIVLFSRELRIEESSDVEEETLDLEKEVVLVPRKETPVKTKEG